MQVVRVSTKKRSEFGKPCVKFAEHAAQIILDIEAKSDGRFDSDKPFYLDSEVQLHPQFSKHEVNTERCETETRGMVHLEGGWPKDVSLDDVEQLKRYRKKVEKDENFLACLFKISKRIEECAKQHIAIDIYEKDISIDTLGTKPDQTAQNINCIVTQGVISDPEKKQRPITSISWNPGDPNKIAFGMSKGADGATSEDEELDENLIYIFDCDKLQKPSMILGCQNSVSSMAYNPKDSTQLLVGCQNGIVTLFDTKKGSPIGTFIAHKAPAQSTVWLQTKSGAEFITSSQEGKVKWWDARKIGDNPFEVLEVTKQKSDGASDEKFDNLLGVTVSEFDSTMPTKLLIGTENGLVFMANRKGKTAAEKLGPSLRAFAGHVTNVQRNPQFPKFFLVSSHSCVAIWCDDVKESPIMNIKSFDSSISTACWSVTRPTLLFIATKTGSVQVFDIMQNVEEPLERIKICKQPLSMMSLNQQGKKLAVANCVGKLYLLDLPESLTVMKKNEKSLASAFFEREQRKEKFVESSRKELNLRIKSAKKVKDEIIEPNLTLDSSVEKELEEEEQAKQCDFSADKNSGFFSVFEELTDEKQEPDGK